MRPRATELVKSVTSGLLEHRTGPGFAVIVVPAGAPDGLDARRLPSRRRYGRISLRSGAAGSGLARRRQSGVSGFRLGARSSAHGVEGE